MRLVADEEPILDVNAVLGQLVHLREERGGIHDEPVADHAHDARMKNAGRDQPEDELDAVDGRLCRQIEHRVEVDRRLGPRASLADEAGPHRVMKSGICVHRFLFRNGSASGLPGPKCFRRTSGSVSLAFSMRTPACAATAVTKSSSSVDWP